MLEHILSGIQWFFTNVVLGFANFFRLFTNPEAFPDFTDKMWLSRFIFYGGSVEFFFIVFNIFLVIFIIGLFQRSFLWSVVRGIEGISNTIGRWSAWALLLMVLQQVMIVALQRIFRVSEITVGPFGYAFTKDLSWFSEELKLYNAIIVTLCCAYTFVQGGHVRVDLVYAAIGYRAKKIIDMLGALFFIIPFMTFVWMFGWYFMWRHLVRGTIAYNKELDHYERISRIINWNVETIAFSPNGFNAYFLFKVLLVAFAGLMFLQGIAYFFRSYLEFREGPEAENRYLDHDSSYEAETVAALEHSVEEKAGHAIPAGGLPHELHEESASAKAAHVADSSVKATAAAGATTAEAKPAVSTKSAPPAQAKAATTSKPAAAQPAKPKPKPKAKAPARRPKKSHKELTRPKAVTEAAGDKASEAAKAPKRRASRKPAAKASETTTTQATEKRPRKPRSRTVKSKTGRK